MKELEEDMKELEEEIFVIWTENETGKCHSETFSLQPYNDVERYIHDGLLKDDNITLKHIIRGKEFVQHFLEKEREVMKRIENKSFVPKIKEVRLNVKIDEPTINGHIYKKDMLENALRDAVNGGRSIEVTRNSDELVGLYMQDIRNVIGNLKDFEIREDGDIILKIMPTLETDLFDLSLATPVVIGTIDKDNIVNIYSIVGFFLANNNDKILEAEGKE